MHDNDSGAEALRGFVGAVQVFAGRLPTLEVGEIPTVVMRLCSAVPVDHSPQRQRIVRDILLEIVSRVEKRIELDPVSAAGRRLLVYAYRSSPDLRSLFREYAAALQRRPPSRPAETGDDWRVRSAVEFIWSNHADHNLSLADVASRVRLSRWHLDRLLRRDTGRCFVAHVNEARLATACALLLTEALSAKEVAAKAGYGSLTSMDRQFKRCFGSTPTSWREARRTD